MGPAIGENEVAACDGGWPWQRVQAVCDGAMDSCSAVHRPCDATTLRLRYLTNKSSLVLSFKKEHSSFQTITGVLRHVATAGDAALSRPTALWCFAIIPGYACYAADVERHGCLLW
jgi:hypothetical protein